MWEQIQANQQRSALLISGMGVLLVLMGFATGVIFAGRGGGFIGLIVAIVIFAVQMVIYFTSAESVLLHGVDYRQLSREDSPRLFNIVEEMCIASGLGCQPRIYLVSDPAPNAFAVGRKPEDSAVVVTSGLMQRLNRDELQGVIAHEIGHLKNRDVQFMTLAAVMLGSIAILADLVWHGMRMGSSGRSRSRSRSGGGGQLEIILFVLSLLLVILGPIMAQLLYFACSRRREYLADASGAQFTRYPEGLASALEKISQAGIKPAFANRTTMPMFIVNPLAAAGEAGIFSTHPSTQERVRILRGMGGASLADYEASFKNARKGDAIIGAQSLNASPGQAIRAASADEGVETRKEVQELSHRVYGFLKVECGCGMTIQVPEGYEQDEIRCVRCGTALHVPSATTPPPLPSSLSEPPVMPMEFVRAGHGWESFRCGCGRTLQISPAFSAPQIECPGCKQIVVIRS